MFNIIKRKKPLHVKFFTCQDAIADLFPPRKLSQATPDWWRSTPAYLDGPPYKEGSLERGMVQQPKNMLKSTKHCYAVQKTFEHAIGLPLWSDVVVEVASNDAVAALAPGKAQRLPGKAAPGEQHPRVQYPGLLPDNWCNWKFNSAWVAYTEEFVPFWMCDPFYHKVNRDWQGMNGAIEFYHQHNLNVNTILRKPPKPKKGAKESHLQYSFNAGEMIAYFVPMVHDRKIVVTAEQVSLKDWDKLHYQQSIWFNHASEVRKRNIGGCPFNLGEGS
jgi:hypothetical protein